jgi:hypothetical protein
MQLGQNKKQIIEDMAKKTDIIVACAASGLHGA